MGDAGVRDRTKNPAERLGQNSWSGIATATEVSTIGIVYAFIVGFLIYGLLIYRSFDWRRLLPMSIETAGLSRPRSSRSSVPPPAWLGA
jgi:hypothetical protein